MDGAFFVVDDEGQKVYSCRGPASPHFGKEIGPVPVVCDGWAGPPESENANKDQRMRDMILAWEARQRARDERR